MSSNTKEKDWPLERINRKERKLEAGFVQQLVTTVDSWGLIPQVTLQGHALELPDGGHTGGRGNSFIFFIHLLPSPVDHGVLHGV